MKNWTLPKEHIAAYGGSSWTSCSFCTCFPFTLSEHTDITLVLLFLSAVSIFNSWLLHQQLALLYEAEDKFRRLCSTVLVTFQSGWHVNCRVTSLERYVYRLQLQKNLSLYYKTTVVTTMTYYFHIKFLNVNTLDLLYTILLYTSWSYNTIWFEKQNKTKPKYFVR